MKLKSITLFVFLLLLSACQTEQKMAQEGYTADSISIAKVSKARAEAFAKGDAMGIAVHFTDSAFLMAPDKSTQRGRAAVKSYYQAIFDEYETELNSYYESVKVSGNMAYGRGFAEVVLKPKKGGTPLKSTAKYLNILERQADGTWKTTHDIWNGNEPVEVKPE